MALDKGPERPVADHVYVFTIGGRCLTCQRTEVEHPIVLSAPDPMTGCRFDHRTVNARWLIGDGGWVLDRCPGCGVMVEPALVTGVVTGVAWGPGRGALAPRTMQHLKAWLGWLRFNGGDGPDTLA